MDSNQFRVGAILFGAATPVHNKRYPVMGERKCRPVAAAGPKLLFRAAAKSTCHASVLS